MMKRVDAFKNLSDNLIENLRFKYSSRDYKVLDHEIRQTFVKVISQDLRFILPLIQSPTLLVWGENDTETPIWMGKTMAAAIPDSALICFNNAGHYAFIEQWQRFCIIIHRFFSGE
jgi:pimeloyl-ACP methyl ester carboxylesterase